MPCPKKCPKPGEIKKLEYECANLPELHKNPEGYWKKL
jgi:hypothetical protein